MGNVSGGPKVNLGIRHTPAIASDHVRDGEGHVVELAARRAAQVGDDEDQALCRLGERIVQMQMELARLTEMLIIARRLRSTFASTPQSPEASAPAV